MGKVLLVFVIMNVIFLLTIIFKDSLSPKPKSEFVVPKIEAKIEFEEDTGEKAEVDEAVPFPRFGITIPVAYMYAFDLRGKLYRTEKTIKKAYDCKIMKGIKKNGFDLLMIEIQESVSSKPVVLVDRMYVIDLGVPWEKIEPRHPLPPKKDPSPFNLITP